MRTATRRHQAGQSTRLLVVRTLNAQATTGLLDLGYVRIPCALGRSGSRVNKREGDGASPSGAWTLREAFYRADRLVRPKTGLPLRALARNDGWCDATADRNYNRRIAHPYAASAEHMWRADGLYDIVIVMGYNDTPCVKGRGSAIFLHCARPGYTPTEGCIALARRDLIRLLPRLTRKTSISIP